MPIRLCGIAPLAKLQPDRALLEQVKNELRSRAARTLESLQATVEEAMQTITTENARGWFKHCGYSLTPD
jgi:hypothetical protein